MKTYTLIFCLILSNCINTNLEKEENSATNDLKKKIESTDFKYIMKLKKQDAIKKYGKPYKQVSFILDDLQGEFRIGLNNIFTKQQRLNENIIIEELTWKKDSKTFITVWYQEINKIIKPIDSFIWDKGTEF